MEALPDGGGAFQPGGEGGGETVGAVFGGILFRGGGLGRDVEREAEVAILRPDVLDRNDAGEAGDIFEILIGPENALEVVVGEEALSALAGDFVDRVDKEDLSSTGFGFGRAADDDAGFHGRVVEEVRTEPKDAFDEVGFDELPAHVRLLLSEQDAVRPEDGAAAGFRVQAFDDVLLEGIIGAALGWSAVEVAAPRVGCKRIAVPLFDRIRGVGEDDIESLEPITLDKLRFGQGVAALDAEVLDPVEKAIHPGNG